VPPPGRVVRRAELQLSVFVRAGDACAGRPLYDEIIDLARCAGLRGATAIRGLQGFGAAANLRPPGLAALTGNEPVLIEITDEATRVLALMPALERLVGSGLIAVKPVTAVRTVADVPDIAASTAT
jgi:uncharacterized protein